MATKNYMINDKWLDLDKQNIVELQSVDGVFDKVYINGEEAGGGGGGSSWQTVFEGSVTTEEPAEAPWAVIPNTGQITADNIRVTFNGTEYECGKNADGTYGALLDESTEEFDWSVYPFNIGYDSGDESMTLITQTAGTYTLKIEEPQSGGSSDFSTAQVTVVNNSQSDAFNFIMAVIMTNGGISATSGLALGTPVGETEVFNVALYKGNAHIQFESDEHLVITTSGNISDLGGSNYMVTGDCTITIS